jgi:hypothetical protein
MSITAILNAYRRPHTIKAQIESLQNQSVRPDEIWVWRNYHQDFNIDLSSLSIADAHDFFKNLKLSNQEKEISETGQIAFCRTYEID